MMTVYGLYATYGKGYDDREVTELVGLFTTKELAERAKTVFWENQAEIKPINVVDNLDWIEGE